LNFFSSFDLHYLILFDVALAIVFGCNFLKKMTPWEKTMI